MPKRLSKITIEGFKSFADRAEMEFGEGIAAIVGPNGSGKSNLSDAVLWVLGEQRTKVLRGASMEDVIYSGNNLRPPAVKCEVSLVLSQEREARKKPEELSIGRQLFRDGDSKYLVNRAACRLQDLQRFISENALAREPYSVISQGRIDEIINAQPQERRELLEQVAGVYHFRKDRERSLRKMEGVEGNLTRAKDILREIEGQIRPLQQQAARAKKWDNLVNQLKTLQVQVAMDNLNEHKERWDRNRTILSGALERSGSDGLLLEELEKNIAASTRSAEVRAEVLNRLNQLRLELSKSAEALAGKLSLMVERSSNLEKNLFEENQEQGAFAFSDRDELQLKEEYSSAQKDLEISRDAIREKEEAIGELDALIMEQDKDLRSKEWQANSLKEALSRNAAREKEITERIGEAAEKHGETGKDASKARDALAVKDSEIKAFVSQVEQTRGDLERKTRALAERNIEIDAANEKINQCREDLKEIEGEFRALEQMGYLVDAKPVSGTLGKLLELLKVNPKDREKVEAALGESLSHMVVSSAESLFETPPQHQGDYIALDIAESWSNGEKRENITSSWAQGNRGLEAYLSRYFPAEDLAEAIRRAREEGEGTYYTPDGHRVDSRGHVSFSTSSRSSASWEIVDRISELQNRRDLLVKEMEALEKSIDMGQVEKDRQETENTRERLERDSRILEEMAREGAVMRERCAGMEEGERSALEELERAKDELKKAEDDESGFSEGIGRLSRELEEGQNALEKLTRQREKLTLELAPLTEASIALGESLAALSEKMRLMEQVKASNAQAKANRESKERLKEIWASKKADWEKESETIREICGNAEMVLEKMTVRVNQLEEEIRELSGAVLDGERKMIDARKRHESQMGEISRLRQEEAALKAEVEYISRTVVEEYQVSLESALQLEPLAIDREAARKKIEGLRERITILGQVNQTAPETLMELEERRETLAYQVDDLNQAKTEIMKTVREIDRVMEEKTTEAFELVDQVFSDYISELFVGGSAGLSWVGEGSSLDKGVEIEVALFQKRPQRLSLLSGGEKALAALAFCMAMQTIRPSPFCLLDEVDSALDDFNLERLKQLLRGVAASQQIILITHQKKSMELADTVYGVSVKGDGSSMVVSQRFKN